MSEDILVVDDDAALRTVLVGLLRQAGYGARGVASAQAALEQVAGEPVDLVVTDVRMPGMDGMALLAALTKGAPDLPVVVITAHGTVAMAVEAMKLGAKDFLLKPFDREEVIATISHALQAAAARGDAPPSIPSATRLVGDSAPMRELRDLVARAARSNATVMLRGESGSGKEVAAREIHDQSARRGAPFVAVHCGALPESLLESELFGYEKGAFTGAIKRKPGRVELAEGGTLFLDEIGDVSLPVQVKLLRLLQEREFSPLGGTATQKADVRFVAATHRDLEAMTSKGEFREDLFYRLNVLPVWLPPLRAREGDVPVLAERFCAEAATRNGARANKLAADAVARLAARPWPGNVRELQSFIERLVVFADGDLVTAADVDREVARARRAPSGGASGVSEPGAPRGAAAGASAASSGDETAPTSSLDAQRAAAERTAVQEALQRAGGNRTVAARLLGVSRRTLYNKLADLGIG